MSAEGTAAARLVVDRQRCVSAGLCVLTAPEVFAQSEEDGQVVLLPGTAAGPDLARTAARLCPSRALTLAEGDGSEG